MQLLLQIFEFYFIILTLLVVNNLGIEKISNTKDLK